MSVPTRTGAAGDVARMLARLIGPGWAAGDGTVQAAEYLGVGASLADTETTIANSGLDAFPSYTVSLLSEWEAIFGLTIDTTQSATVRQKALTTRARTRVGGSPQRLVAALELYAPEVAITETTLPAGAFHFAVVVSVDHFTDPTANAGLNGAIAVMKPAHTMGRLTTQVGFLCDDPRAPGHPGSVCDDTVLAL